MSKSDEQTSGHIENGQTTSRKVSESGTETAQTVEEGPAPPTPITIRTRSSLPLHSDASSTASRHDVSGALDAKELNALTYPNYQIQIDLKGEIYLCYSFLFSVDGFVLIA